MNWLLTNCAAPERSPFYTGEKRPPLGIGFLISSLRHGGHRVSFVDQYLRPGGFLESGTLSRQGIDAVGISVNTICYRDFVRMADRLLEMRERGVWKGLVVVGGPHVTALPESIPDWVDHLVVGEGERAILDIAAGGAERVVRAARIDPLDALEPPAWDVFAGLPYDWTVAWLGVEPVFTMNTSRGCPFDCVFCSVPENWGRLYRCFSAEWIIGQIQLLVRRYGCRGIYFREDNFTAKRARVESFCGGLLGGGIDIEWMCETRVDALDRPLLELMYRSGCRALYLGVESGSPRMLRLMNKGITVDQIEAVFAWCGEIGIKTYASFVVGIPSERPEDRKATRELVERIRPTKCGYCVFVGIPKSRLYTQVLEQGQYACVDECGLVYLPGHDALVDEYYGGDPSRKMPRQGTFASESGPPRCPETAGVGVD